MRLGAGRHEHGFSARRQHGRCIALIERIGDQDDGTRACLRIRRDDERREEQPFARAVQRQDVAFGIDHGIRQCEAPPEPACGRLAPIGCAVDGGIFAELVRVARDCFGDERRHDPARIAHREAHRHSPRLHGIEQVRQLHERPRRKLGKAAWKHVKSVR